MKMVVAQMYNCIRMEFRKCFHSHNFIISMATCVLLALSSASYCCQGYLNIHDALDQYCFENGHMVSNELFPVWTSYNYWIGGESETLAYSAFYTLLPLFAILPHSLSCLQEKKSSYANQMVVRVGRQPYYLSKGIVFFSAAFITIVIPLILNFAVTAAFIPSTVPQINYEIYNHVYFGAMWADLFYTHPALYVTLYILLDGLFAGLIALIGYAFSFYMKQKTIVPALPFLLPSLFGVGVFYAVPFAVSVFFTFTQGVAHPHFAGLQNFRELWGTAVFRQALGNTVLFLTVGLCLLLALALFAALVCAKGRFAPQELALLLPMVIPVNSFALGWQSLWGQNGAVNRLLGLAGREPVDFLNGAAAFPLLVALYLIKNIGCVSLILAAVIRAVPQDYQDAYQLDSTSEWGYVRRVLLPLLTPTLLIGMLLGISNYFLMFRDVYALYGSNPPARLYMLQHFMNGNFYQLNHQLLSAAALATVLLITGTVWFGKRCTVEKTENGKGRRQ